MERIPKSVVYESLKSVVYVSLKSVVYESLKSTFKTTKFD